jgi:small-conductance mechanosensitive channel
MACASGIVPECLFDFVLCAGTTGAAIALMLILAIVMMIPAARKGAWFRCFTFFIAVVSIVFLIAAVSAGYVMMARSRLCFAL